MTESKILHVMNEVAKGRVSITIAHRLSTIMDCDKILVMKAGIIVEAGTHSELLQIKDGVYKSLWDHQGSRSYFERDFETTEVPMDMGFSVDEENIASTDKPNNVITEQSINNSADERSNISSNTHLLNIKEKLSDSIGTKSNYHTFENPTYTNQ